MGAGSAGVVVVNAKKRVYLVYLVFLVCLVDFRLRASKINRYLNDPSKLARTFLHGNGAHADPTAPVERAQSDRVFPSFFSPTPLAEVA